MHAEKSSEELVNKGLDASQLEARGTSYIKHEFYMLDITSNIIKMKTLSWLLT